MDYDPLPNGVHEMEDKEYFGRKALSNSYLWRSINKTPAHAIAGFESAATEIGRATHLAVLQPEFAQKMLIQGPKDRRGKKWTEVKEALDEGQILLTEGDYNLVCDMRDAIWSNSFLAGVLTHQNAHYERAAFWEYRGHQCKCKVDADHPDVIIDLKTSTDASPRGFAKSVHSFGYHQQAASYRYGWNQAAGTQITVFLFLVIEKTKPFAAAVYELDAATLAEGWASYNAAIDLEETCIATENYHGYPQERMLLGLPPYGFRFTNQREIEL